MENKGECKECNGAKRVEWVYLDGEKYMDKCPRCKGTGIEPYKECAECGKVYRKNLLMCPKCGNTGKCDHQGERKRDICLECGADV